MLKTFFTYLDIIKHNNNGTKRKTQWVIETGSRRGAAELDRDLGSRSRAARQQERGRSVEAGGSGRLSRWTGVPILEEGVESGEKSGAYQSKGGEW